MKIIPIFAPNLYAVKYPNEEFDELERLFDEWNNVEILRCFYEKNETDLEYFQINIDEAIIETLKEAKAFRKTFIEINNNGNDKFDFLFVNLDDTEYRILELIEQKSKKRWLRLYALRIDENVFLITGGAIKLTRKMEAREHTAFEIQKLNQCKQYLIDNGVFDSDSFYEMINEDYENR